MGSTQSTWGRKVRENFVKMNNILRSVVIGTVINTARGYGKVALKAEFEWNWNMQNRCGPRPSGPKYPYPPDTNGSFVDPGNCDIIQDQTYIYNYECETSCQEWLKEPYLKIIDVFIE